MTADERTIRIYVRLPRTLHDRLHTLAYDHNRSLAQEIVTGLYRYVTAQRASVSMAASDGHSDGEETQ